MSLESFYGGKQGISPVIKYAFKYIDVNDNAYKAAIAAGATAAELKDYTMDSCFAESTYENVWYSELCIIDTTNKNNPNNGKLFRRTLKGKGDSGKNLCAEYIKSLLEGKELDLKERIEALKETSGKKFFDKDKQDVFPEKDFYLSTEVNKYNSVLKVEKDINTKMDYVVRIDV